MKQVLQYILTLLVALTAYINMCAQTVTNVEARQEGQTIVITFNMDKPADFDLYFSSSGTYGKFVYIDKEYLDIQRLSDNEYYCRWHVLDQFEEFDNNFVVFRVEPKKSRTEAYKSEANPCYFSFGGFYSLNDDLGATIRFGYKGVYAGFKSNFRTNKDFSNYNVNIKSDYFREGSELVSRWSGVLGCNLFWRQKVMLCLGVGYGTRIFTAERISTVAWQNGKRCLIEDNSAKGLELETDVNAFLTDKCGLSFGYSVLAFNYSEFMCGLVFRW